MISLVDIYLKSILQISSVECFFANISVFFFIVFNFSGLSITLFKTSREESFFLSQMPVPLLSKNSAFSSSWPGIGLIIIIGKFDAKLSEVVNQPGFEITKSEIDINSGTLFVNAKTFTDSCLLFSSTIFSNSDFIFSFFPAIAMT